MTDRYSCNILNCSNCQSYKTINSISSVPVANAVAHVSPFTSVSQKRHKCIVKGDSAASQHYWQERDVDVLETIHEEPGPPVTLPNSSTINDNKVGYKIYKLIVIKYH